jgi:hypothetical protein
MGFNLSVENLLQNTGNGFLFSFMEIKTLEQRFILNSAADKAVAILERLSSFWPQEIKGRRRGFCV